MVKYIFKESELRSMIEGIVAEEVNNVLNEGLGTALGKTLKNAALGVVAPAMLASKAITKTDAIINGDDTVLGTIRDYFGSGSGSSGGSGRKTRGQRQNERLANGRNVSYEYGKPEIVPSWGSRVKLDEKREIVAPPWDSKKKTGCMLPWGSFGMHYHDEGDRVWNRLIIDKERSILRVAGSNPAKRDKLMRRYKKILTDWLKARDKAYKIYIKENNRI